MPYSYGQGRYVHDFPPLPEFQVERNLLTFAAARSGKGATQIIPFLLANTGINALVIDPKAEAAEQTAATREAAGQAVHVLDPMKTSRITTRARVNFLDEIDPNSNAAFRQINALADGLVMRHDPKGGHWDEGGMQVLSGFIAHVLSAPDYEGRRSLVTVRELLKLQGEEFGAVVDAMAQNHACGGLPAAGAGKLLHTGNEAGHFLSVATSNTSWIDDPDIAEYLSESTFRLSDLKTQNTDVFLVLPMDAVEDYGTFLRLFVRMALYHMQQKLPNGELKGKETYFILDEFFTLGHMEKIQKGMGAMPGYNLRLWPFLQDYNQMLALYGQAGAGTFFSNSDATYFFGINDPDTANLAARMVGNVAEHDIGVKPPDKPQVDIPKPAGWLAQAFGFETQEQKAYRVAHIPPTDRNAKDWLGNEELEKHHRARAEWDHNRANEEADYQNAMNEYAHARATIGHPRIAPEQAIQITKRNPDRKIAETAIVIREGVGYTLPLTAYFEQGQPVQATPEPSIGHFLSRDLTRESALSGTQCRGKNCYHSDSFSTRSMSEWSSIGAHEKGGFLKENCPKCGCSVDIMIKQPNGKFRAMVRLLHEKRQAQWVAQNPPSPEPSNAPLPNQPEEAEMTTAAIAYKPVETAQEPTTDSDISDETVSKEEFIEWLNAMHTGEELKEIFGDTIDPWFYETLWIKVTGKTVLENMAMEPLAETHGSKMWEVIKERFSPMERLDVLGVELLRKYEEAFE